LLSEEAFRIMREEVKRGWWDAHLVEKFERLIAKGAVA
jgi:hypothetical protein